MTAKVLCHKDLGFIMIRKSCTTSIKWAVLNAMGCMKPDGSIHRDSRLNYHFLEDCTEVKTVAIIRCPYRRILSTWRNKMYDRRYDPGTDRLRELGLKPGCSFDQFVRDARPVLEREGHLRPQCLHLPKRVDYMLRFENIDAEWPLLQRQHPWLPDLPHRNSTQYGRASWEDYYHGATRRQVAEMYRHDLALWQALQSRPAGNLEDARWIT